uniref:Uncharacterized protein n=1 Tax=Setaria italica TaxID=4555 RepID=K3XU75_SETIT
MHLGSMYSQLPTMAVPLREPCPGWTCLTSPKSPSLASNASSSITLLGLMSRCRMASLSPVWRYSMAEPMPRTILYLSGHVSSLSDDPWRWSSRLPLVTSSYTSRSLSSPPPSHHPTSFTRLRCFSWPKIMISVT